jgi:hypothetical protein
MESETAIKAADAFSEFEMNKAVAAMIRLALFYEISDTFSNPFDNIKSTCCPCS